MPAEDNLPDEVMDLAVLWVKAEPNLRAFVAAAVREESISKTGDLLYD